MSLASLLELPQSLAKMDTRPTVATPATIKDMAVQWKGNSRRFKNSTDITPVKTTRIRDRRHHVCYAQAKLTRIQKPLIS